MTTVQQVVDWRIQQGQILDYFIQAWLDVDPLIRDRQPLRLDVSTPMPRYVIDNHGTRIAEVSLRKGETYVEWIRSLDDLRTIDTIGRSMAKHMEEERS